MNLYFNDLSKSYQGKTVFDTIHGAIHGGDKIGLIGANGKGKTTLARILAGQEVADAGEIRRSPAYGRIFYVEQYPMFNANVSVYEEIYRMASRDQNHSKDYPTMVKKTLNKVGLGEERWGQRAASLSGGEKTKLVLGKAMVCDFDLLILDEPTNHLDMNSYIWLEEFVQNLGQPLLMISHDRFFLDRVVNRIWHLTDQGLKVYEGNYSAYKMQRELERVSITKEYEKQQNQIQQLGQMIHQRKNWYKNAHQAAGQNDFYRSKAKKHASVLKAKERELARIEKNKIEKPKKALSPAFEVINKSIIGKKFPRFLVQVEKLCKSYGNKVLFQDISFNLGRQDKIALIGQNGVGKTSLLKTICHLDQDYRGTITINPSVKIGYFAQELDNLHSGSTILDEVLIEGSTVEETRLLLACLLFRGDAIYKKIANLSMGERGRVAFAKLILSGANLLVLDEPTNYMDIESKEKIEEVLEEFEGVVLFVSHDQYFIQRLANGIFQIENRKLYCYDGDYAYYLSKCKEQKGKEESGLDYTQLTDNIRRLECELAFLSGKLNEPLEQEEKARLNERFLATAKELRSNKDLLKGHK
ncbi:ribosomal protection-like ABC-F family protein [Desulfotomaculum sp. 1211_IL3151]|uniref:ribosomal protection-like ABC-F family protein n=1 Tax=Desulfotomaculum sp. 1211_IL3151 TaxID=3084055 RepID=UPI002FDA942D